DACTDDGNACTSEACNASGTCVHASLPAGTACTTDHNACTTDTCDAAGACIHPAVADGTACVADTDACTDDVCQSGTCLGVPLPDTDGDGVCDATDPCATGGAIDAFVFSSGTFDTPAGDDRLTVRGRLTIAA